MLDCGSVLWLSFSPDGGRVLTSGDLDCERLLDERSPNDEASAGPPPPVRAEQRPPDGKLFLRKRVFVPCLSVHYAAAP